MLKRLLSLIPARDKTKVPVNLPTLDRADIEHLVRDASGLPQVDWGMAHSWAAHQLGEGPQADRLLRAVAATWLDLLRDALSVDHRRWRTAQVEGLAPLEHAVSNRVAAAVETSIREITRALRPIRGESPIPALAIVALASADDYYNLISHFYPEEGEFATSGGVYLRHAHMFPLIAMPTQVRHEIEETIAHELTHHALAQLDIPNWAEEGLTQMMEERVSGRTNFKLDREMLDRHRALWGNDGFELFWSGAAFSSPREDDQELAYHLSQLLVRRLLTDRPAAFFAFARAASSGDHGRAAAIEHLGFDLDEFASATLELD